MTMKSLLYMYILADIDNTLCCNIFLGWIVAAMILSLHLEKLCITKYSMNYYLYFTGVNMPDHDVIFSQLATELNNQVTPFVALLRSKDCSGSVHFSYTPYC